MKDNANKNELIYSITDISLLIIAVIVAVYQMLEIHNVIALLLVIWAIIRSPGLKIFSLITVLSFVVASLFLFIKRPDAASAAAIVGFYSLFFSIILLILRKK